MATGFPWVGPPLWPWSLSWNATRHPEITRVALYLDNDLAGRINARKIKSLLKSDQRFSKIRVSVNPPRSVKDYNEKLQRTLQEIREEKHASRQKQAAVSI